MDQKKIIGHLEFFSELGITAAVVRSLKSKGSFDDVLAIKDGDRLILTENNEVLLDIIVESNISLQVKHHSGVIIPKGLEYEKWLDLLRKNTPAELIKNPNSK